MCYIKLFRSGLKDTVQAFLKSRIYVGIFGREGSTRPEREGVKYTTDAHVSNFVRDQTF
jgi:hypothetical protein